MKQVHGITSRGLPKNDIRCALVMSHADREAREYLRVNAGNITYAQFEYDMIPKTVPAIERRWPGEAMPVDEARFKGPVPADYWNPSAYTATIGRSHTHVHAQRVREAKLMRALMSRRAEWQALRSAIVNA